MFSSKLFNEFNKSLIIQVVISSKYEAISY